MRPALVITWVGSVVAIILAVIEPLMPNIYSGSLAVLTATLIAIIWYTYYTHVSVTRLEPVWVKAKLEKHAHLGLTPIIENVTKTRILEVRPELHVWVKDEEVDFGPFYRASHEERVILGPGESFGGKVRFDQAVPFHVAGNSYGESRPEPGAARITFRVFWKDDAGVEGSTPLRHYTMDHISGELVARLGAAEVTRHFSTPASVIAPAQ
jgi:hypothetical protein